MKRKAPRVLTAANHLRNSSLDHVAGSICGLVSHHQMIRESFVPPLGSSSFGNMSVPQMDHAAAAVTIPVKANTAFYTCFRGML